MGNETTYGSVGSDVTALETPRNGRVTSWLFRRETRGVRARDCARMPTVSMISTSEIKTKIENSDEMAL